jgi:cytochrome c oxidase cbb3-type subunit 4
MSIGMIRGLLTLATFVAFITLWIWAWSKHRKHEFEAAALLPLESHEFSGERGDRS